MSRLSLIALTSLVASASAFAPAKQAFVSTTPLHMAEEEDTRPAAVFGNSISTEERGVSLDQDGKSNVWAIEPKMEIETKSADEKTGGALIAVGGFGVFAVAAGLILTNLPDPNSF